MSLNKLLIQRSLELQNDYSIETYSGKNILIVVTKEQLDYLLMPHDATKSSMIDCLIIDKKILEELKISEIGKNIIACLSTIVKKTIEI